MPSIRLVALNGTEIAVLRGYRPSAGDTVFCSKFDPGFSKFREDVQDRADRNGTLDFTQFYGARSVTADVVLIDPDGDSDHSKGALLRTLSRLNTPDQRFYIYFYLDHFPEERRMLVRPNPLSFSMDRLTEVQYTVSLAYECPSGSMEAVEATEDSIRPHEVVGGSRLRKSKSALSPRGGFERKSKTALAPRGGFERGISGSANLMTLTNDGDVPTAPRWRVYGPAADFTITNKTTNKYIKFTSVDIPSNAYLDVDVDSMSALMNSSAGQSYLNKRVLGSTWFMLERGDNDIEFEASGTGANTELVVDFRSQWIGY